MNMHSQLLATVGARGLPHETASPTTSQVFFYTPNSFIAYTNLYIYIYIWAPSYIYIHMYRILYIFIRQKETLLYFYCVITFRAHLPTANLSYFYCFRIRSSQIAIPYKFCILFSPFPNCNPDPASFPTPMPTLLFIVHLPEKKRLLNNFAQIESKRRKIKTKLKIESQQTNPDINRGKLKAVHIYNIHKYK